MALKPLSLIGTYFIDQDNQEPTEICVPTARIKDTHHVRIKGENTCHSTNYGPNKLLNAQNIGFGREFIV